jgi:uncharacterized protein (DUF1330 family)
MAAYVVVDTKIHDAEGYERYKALAAPIAKKFGGKYLARGGEMHIIDDDLWVPTRMVILEYPDIETARAFTDSDEYAPVAALRHEFADSTLVIVEGA